MENEINLPREYTHAESPFSEAVWIAPSYPVDAPIITSTFDLDKIGDARLYVTALGYFEASVNGHSLTDDRLIPVASDYHSRDLSDATYTACDIRTYRIYYYEYEIKDFLTLGENSIEFRLGGGWYNQTERVAEGHMEYGDRPRLIYTLSLGQRQIVSSGDETWRESEIRSSNIFIGEVIDRTYRDENEKKVIALPHPEESLFTPSLGIPDRIIRKLEPERISSKDGVHVYDIGENTSALVSICTSAPRGTEYTLRFSERLNRDGTLDFLSTGSPYIGTSGNPQIMTDVFIADGSKCTFMPRFVWHAFRYFELTGDISHIEKLEVHVIHADVAVTSEFESDSEGANFLYDAYLRTQLSNYHGSFPSDCPHRERLGYTGDGQICAKAAMMLTDSRALYEKWILDIIDGQDKETGHVQHTAPFQGGGGGPGGWCSAIVTVPYAYYRQFGYGDILRRAIPAMKKWIEFTVSCIEDGLVVKEQEGGWCLGDWCMKESAKLPEGFVNTCWFIHALRLYKELTDELGITDAFPVTSLEENCVSAVKEMYSTLKDIGAARVYAAWIGIDSAEGCAEYYGTLGCFDTGFLGTDILMEVLFRHGYGDVAHKLLSSREMGSFLYMKDNGATTVWERWRIGGSESHPMFSACVRQLFEGILGIRQSEGSVAYERVVISPLMPKGMNRAKGSILTPGGRISVSLMRVNGTLHAEITVPAKIKCDVDAGLNASVITI